MKYKRLIFYFYFLFYVTAAQASSLWGSPKTLCAEERLQGIWGEKKELVNAETENTLEFAGLFFSDENQEQEDLPPWLENAVAVPDVAEDSPMIAIVIDDLGLNRKKTQEVLNLPAPLTVSFLYYADHLEEQTQAARLAGHELLLHTPMEPINPKFEPGPLALKTGMAEEDLKERLQIMLDSFAGYVGINNHMGSRFTADETGMRIVMDVIKKRGLLILDSLTSNRSIISDIAQEKDIPYAVRNVFLDNAHNEEKIMKQLFLLERHARKHRFAVGIGHPHKVTINALKKWIPQAKKRGVVFVPISLIAVYMQDDIQFENMRSLNPHDEEE